jgi:copper(I)-binding protein
MRRWLALSAAALFSLISSLAARADDTGISAHHGKIYETEKAGLATQGFIEIENSAATPDTLTGVACPIAESTTIVGKNGAPISQLTLGPGEHLLLSPAGPHLLLQSTHFGIDPGGAVPCALTFQNAGEIQVYLYPIPAP